MNCNKCGTFNELGSKFCIKCGNSLINQENVTSNLNMNYQVNNFQNVSNNINQSESIQMPQQINSKINYFKYMLWALIKPVQTTKEENANLANAKNSFILALIVGALMTVANFIKTLINTVRVVNYGIFDGVTTTWDFSRIKDIKFIDVIGKNFLIYFGLILGITVIFYLGSLVIKKNLNFNKTLSNVAIAVIPVALCSFLLAPIMGLLWNQFNIILTIVGLTYSFIMLYEIINNEMALENDKKIYFNAICFSIILVVGYFIFMKLFMSQASDLENLFNIFN